VKSQEHLLKNIKKILKTRFGSSRCGWGGFKIVLCLKKQLTSKCQQAVLVVGHPEWKQLGVKVAYLERTVYTELKLSSKPCYGVAGATANSKLVVE
jgi:hypothetical protein